jgi:hypothetical protein
MEEDEFETNQKFIEDILESCSGEEKKNKYKKL